MKTFQIYFLLFILWAEFSQAFSLSISQVKGVSLINLSIYFLLLVWGFSTVFTRKLLQWNIVCTYLMLFIFVVIISVPYKILLNELPNSSLKQGIVSLKNWVEPYLIFFITFNIIDDKKICKRSLFGLMILLLIASVSTPLVSLNIIKFGHSTIYQGRASGFSNTGEFSSYLVLFVPLLVTFVVFHKKYALRAYSAVVLFATLVALIITGSRNGILSFLVSMLCYLYMFKRQKMIGLQALLSVMVVIIMFGAISFLVAPSKVIQLVSHRLDPTESESLEDYSSGRLRIWRNSIILFAERPIFGHGYRTSANLMGERFEYRVVTHNQYLMYLVELGVIGCTLYILVLLKIFKVIWHYQKITPYLWEKKLYISYVAGFIGYTCAMLFVNMGAPRYFFWFYTAVFLRYGQLQEID